MQLTTDNTAIVLDSTSDYPEAPSRFANMRFVPLYVRFGDETHRDYVELAPAEFFEKLRTSPELPATSQPTPQDFVGAYEELAAYDRIYSLHVSAKLSGTFQSAELAATETRRRPRSRRRLAERLAGDRDARARDPAAAHARHDRRGDRRARRALLHRLRRRLHARDVGVPPARRADRSRGRARGIAPERAPRSSRSRRARSSRSRACVDARRRSSSSSGASKRRPRTGPGCGSRSRTPTRRSGSASSASSCGACARRPTSSSPRPSARSSALTRARAPSASSGSRTTPEPRCARVRRWTWTYSGPSRERDEHSGPAACRLRRPGRS